MAVQLIDELPETDAHIILQMDRWYTCQAVWDKTEEKGVAMIGDMKPNRILYPDGKKIPASDYARNFLKPVPPCNGGRPRVLCVPL